MTLCSVYRMYKIRRPFVGVKDKKTETKLYELYQQELPHSVPLQTPPRHHSRQRPFIEPYPDYATRLWKCKNLFKLASQDERRKTWSISITIKFGSLLQNLLWVYFYKGFRRQPNDNCNCGANEDQVLPTVGVDDLRQHQFSLAFITTFDDAKVDMLQTRSR